MAKFWSGRGSVLMALALCAVGTQGCGSSSQVPPTTAEVTTPDAAGEMEDEAPDLSPVTAPQELVLVGRLKNPAGTVNTLLEWTNTPLNWRALLAAKEPELEKVIAFDAPVEVAAVMDPMARSESPAPFVAFSVGLLSVQSALDLVQSRGWSIHRIRAGVYRLEETAGMSCMIAVSLGTAPGRLVCGDEPEHVDALLAYMTRGLPTESLSSSSDLHLELRFEPLKRRHAKSLSRLKLLVGALLPRFQLDNPRFDRALADAAHALADELVFLTDDVSQLKLDLSPSKDQRSFDLRARLELSSGKSWVAHVLEDSGARQAPPSEIFWNLPSDATSAGYSGGIDPALVKPIVDTTSELIDGLFEYAGLPPKLSDQVVDSLDEIYPTTGYVFASGGTPKQVSSTLSSVSEWSLVVFNEKSKDYIGAWTDLARAYNDPKLRRALDKGLEQELDLPKVVRRAPRFPSPAAGSVVFDIALPVKTGADTKHVLLVMVPNGERTLVGFGWNERKILEKLGQVRKGEGGLAKRQGLEVLKELHVMGAGFTSLASGFGSLPAKVGEGSRQLLAQTPHRGQAPIVYTVEVGKAPLSVDLKFSVPREAFRDLAAMGPQLFGLFMSGAASTEPSEEGN